MGKGKREAKDLMSPNHGAPQIIVANPRTTFLHELTSVCGKYGYDIKELSKTDEGYSIDFERVSLMKEVTK